MRTITRPLEADELFRFLGGDPFIKIATIDVDGLLRGKLISREKFYSLFDEKKEGNGELAYCAAVFGWDMHDRFYPTEYSNSSNGFADALARVDLSTFRRIPWENERPFFLLNMLDPHTREELPVCPRSLLKNVAKKAADMGFKALAGVEYEFVTYKLPARTDRPEERHSINSFLSSHSPAALPNVFDTVNAYNVLSNMTHDRFYSGILETCSQFRVPVEGFHAESGPSMYEAAVAYAEITEAADRALLFKHAVKGTAAAIGGLQPSFMAKPKVGYQGLSGHTHISLVDKETGENLFARAEEDKSVPKDIAWLSDIGRSFLAGVLQALPDIMPLLAPNINSYKRLVDNYAAPVTVSWAYESRLGSVRIISPPTSHSTGTRLEIRVPGADTCAHLVFSAVLAAGLRGVEQKLDLLTAPGCPPPLSQTLVSTGLGEPVPGERLPRSLEEATEKFRNSPIVKDLFDPRFINHYALTRDEEVGQWRQAVTNWEFLRYIEHV